MILNIFTLFHTLLSLVGIGSGVVVVYGLLASKRFDHFTTLFLVTTMATSATGFLFPFHGFTPAQGLGIVSLIVLGTAMLARYRYRLVRGWRLTYVITCVMALYLNVFVLIVQLFRHVPPLAAIAPTQSEPPFQIAQLLALLLFVVVGFLAARKFHNVELPALQSKTLSAAR